MKRQREHKQFLSTGKPTSVAMAEVESTLHVPFDTEKFNAIASLHDVTSSFQERGGKEMVDESFRSLFKTYGLESKLGVGLLHRHFDLETGEKLVEFNNIAVPWKHHEADEYIGGKLVPNAWLVTQGDSGASRLMPYEYFFTANNGLDQQQGIQLDNAENISPQFLEVFAQRVLENGLEDTIALRAFPYKGYTGGLEITQGRANINFLPEEVPEEILSMDTTETAFFFDEDWRLKKYSCICKGYSGHMHFHSR